MNAEECILCKGPCKLGLEICEPCREKIANVMKCTHCGAYINGKGNYFKKPSGHPPRETGTYDQAEQSKAACEAYGIPLSQSVAEELKKRAQQKKEET